MIIYNIYIIYGIYTETPKIIIIQDNPKVPRRNTHQEYQRISQDRNRKLAPKYLFWCAIEELNAPKRNLKFYKE